MTSKFLLIVFLTVTSYSSLASCRINLAVKNTGRHELDVRLWGRVSAVKMRGGGRWKPLKNAGWFTGPSDLIELEPSETKGDGFMADYGCNVRRRYRISYICRGGIYDGNSVTTYYPSSTTWTRNQTLTVNLGQCI